MVVFPQNIWEIKAIDKNMLSLLQILLNGRPCETEWERGWQNTWITVLNDGNDQVWYDLNNHMEFRNYKGNSFLMIEKDFKLLTTCQKPWAACIFKM